MPQKRQPAGAARGTGGQFASPDRPEDPSVSISESKFSVLDDIACLNGQHIGGVAVSLKYQYGEYEDFWGHAAPPEAVEHDGTGTRCRCCGAWRMVRMGRGPAQWKHGAGDQAEQWRHIREDL